jgi:hypothetical protein
MKTSASRLKSARVTSSAAPTMFAWTAQTIVSPAMMVMAHARSVLPASNPTLPKTGASAPRACVKITQPVSPIRIAPPDSFLMKRLATVLLALEQTALCVQTELESALIVPILLGSLLPMARTAKKLTNVLIHLARTTVL